MAGRVIINDQALRDLLQGPNGAVVKAMNDIGRQVRNEAVRRCPVDEGRLRASITNTVTVQGTKIIVRVGTVVEYALYVHNGTGIYGPSGKPITPLRLYSPRPVVAATPYRAALRFKPKGSGAYIFRYSVKGARANPFLTDALTAVLRPLGWPIRIRRPTGGPGKGAG